MATREGEKTGGRQKGTPNKVTSEVRSVIADLVSRMAHNVSDSFTDQTFKDLSIEDQTRLLSRLLPYIVPKVHLEEDRPLETKYVVLGMVKEGDTITGVEHLPVTPLGFSELDHQVFNALPDHLKRKVFPAGVIQWVSTGDEAGG